MKQNIKYKPDGLNVLEDIRKDLLSAYSNINQSDFKVSMLNNLISKINIAIQILTFNPRLPLFQIEERIKEICNNDKTTNGVVVEIQFSERFEKIDKSLMSYLKIIV